MHTLSISDSWANNPEAKNTEERKLVLRMIKALQEEKAKVYSTYVISEYDDDDKQYVLVTPSKSLHLDLGRFSSVAQYYFCSALEDEFEYTGVAVFMVFLPDKDTGEDRDVGILVSRTEESDGGSPIITYTLSMAR